MEFWQSFQERKRKDDMLFLSDFFDGSDIDGAIIKIEASDDGEANYENITGRKPMDEPTLLVCNDNNDIHIVFKSEEKSEIIPSMITEKISTINKIQFDNGCMIVKKEAPKKIPKHLMNLFQFVNININITQDQRNSVINNNMGGCSKNTHDKGIDSPRGLLDKLAEMRICDGIDFLEKNFERGKVYMLKDITSHIGWKNEYKSLLDTKRLHICKSCGKRWLKGCCDEYARDNRTMKVVVTGWHHL